MPILGFNIIIYELIPIHKQKLYKKLNTVDIQFWNQYKVGDVLTILDNDIEIRPFFVVS